MLRKVQGPCLSLPLYIVYIRVNKQISEVSMSVSLFNYIVQLEHGYEHKHTGEHTWKCKQDYKYK